MVKRFRFKKYVPPPRPEPSPEAVRELEAQLRRQIDAWGWLQMDPEERVSRKQPWTRQGPPGIHAEARVLKEKMLDALFPPDPGRKKRP